MKNLSKREKVLIFIMVCVIITFAIGFLLILPQKKKYDDLNMQYGIIKADKQSMQYQIGEVQGKQSQLDELQSEVEKVKQNFSKNMSADDINFIITGALQKYSLKPKSLLITPVQPETSDSTEDSSQADSQAEQEPSALVKMSITIQADGDVNNINLFADEISKMPSISVNTFNIEKTEAGFSMKLTAEIKMLSTLS